MDESRQRATIRRGVQGAAVVHAGVQRDLALWRVWMPYEVQAGKVATWALEAHVVDHCNLRCVQCCTMSPELAPSFVDPALLEKDLALAARVLSPAVFKLTGGEPSLHPHLVDCLRAARASGISPRISITTNGLLARQWPDEVFHLVDRITLSVYGSAPLPSRTLTHIEAECRRHDVLLAVKPIGIFQDMTPSAPGDDEQTSRAFHSCWLKVRCHTVHAGRFFVCTRPPHLASALAARGVTPLDLSRDGVALAGEAGVVLRDVLGRLESTVPLASCRYCLGAMGAWRPHEQEPGGAESRLEPP